MYPILSETNVRVHEYESHTYIYTQISKSNCIPASINSLTVIMWKYYLLSITYADHQCTTKGCGQVFVMDGNMKTIEMFALQLMLATLTKGYMVEFGVGVPTHHALNRDTEHFISQQ